MLTSGLVSLGTRVLGLPKLELKTKRKHEGVLIDFHIPSIEHSFMEQFAPVWRQHEHVLVAVPEAKLRAHYV